MRRTRNGLAGSVIVVAVSMIALVPRVWAQTPEAVSPADVPAAPSSQPLRPAASQAWRITFRAGGGLANTPSAGTSALPVPGLPQDLPFGLTTRQVPSWYFGDGASILNNFVGNSHPIVPLDAMLTSAAIAQRTGASFGVTVSRSLSGRYRLNLSIDGARSGPTFTTGALAAIESSRASFTNAWNAFLAATGLQTQSVTSTASIVQGSSLEWLATGAIDITLLSTGRSTWYATFGGGLVSDAGAGPSATLTGNYAFTQNPSFNLPFNETDTVVVRSARTTRAVAILGGGWTHDMSRRWGFNADARLVLSGNGLRMLVDATPTRVLQTNPNREIVLAFGPNPAIEFNNAAGGAPPFISTLSGGPLAGFMTFTGTGLQIRAELTGGIFLRF